MKCEGSDGWNSTFPPTSWKPHLWPGIGNPEPPAPGVCQLPLALGLPHFIWPQESWSAPLYPSPFLDLQIPAPDLRDPTIQVPRRHSQSLVEYLKQPPI